MRWLCRLIRKGKLETQLDSELRFHVEQQIADNIAAGMKPAEARRRALAQFGGTECIKEECRDARGTHFFEALFQDVRFTLRILRKTPLITTVALLSLALGIGANTAIFSLIDKVMLSLLPVQKPAELVEVMRYAPWYDEPVGSFTNPIWEQVRDHQDVFSGVLAWSERTFDLANGGEAENVNGIYASGEYFTTLGVRPILGRLLIPADDRRACSGAAVVSYGFWRQHYGGAENAIGSLLRLNGHSFPVIGVTPPGFFGVNVGDKFDVAIPICSEAIMAGKNSMLDHHSSWWLSIVGRLKPGVSLPQATARLTVLAPEIYANALPPDWPAAEQARFLRTTFVIRSAGTGISNLRRQYERPLQILMVIVGLVLLIACANIASLLLARSAARQKEIAVRLSLGATRARLIRQVLTESLVLSGAGAVLGILFARWGGALLVRFVSTSQQPVFLNLSMDGRVLGFAIGIAILAGLLFGILPALRATRVPLISAMKQGCVEDAQVRSHVSSGRWIVAVQVALSLILLIGTGLFVRSFRNLITLDPGFARDHVLLVNTDIHNAHIEAAARASLYGHILARLQSVPGAVSAGQCWFTPTEGAEWNDDIQIAGRPKPTGDENLVWFNWTTPSYFPTMRTPLLEGRNFDGRDTPTSPPVAVVNETMARHFFPNANPVGKYFSVDAGSMLAAKPIQIIGVVKDAKYGSLREPFLPTAYIPLAQIMAPPERTAFEIRTVVNPTSVIPSVRDAIADISKPASLEFITLSQQVDDSLAQERLLAMLSAFFGVLAVLLTAIGLYGVMAYVVTQRTHEIGIRMALGAQPSSVLRLVMRDVAVLLGVGAGSGILASLWLTRLVQQLLFGVPATDAVTLSFAVVTLFVVALVASYLPARRAMRVDPMVALRYE